MAKIKFGMMMTDARGKLGGQVFSKNRSGAYVRTKVTPVNPQTEYQQQNRALLGSISSSWSGLSESQRNAWNGVVTDWQKTNVFGDLNKPSGKNLFTGLNKNRTNYFPSLAIQTLPPAKVEFPAIVVSDAVFISSTNTLEVELSLPVENTQFVVFRATPIVSAGTTYVKNQLRDFTVAIPGAGDSTFSIGAQYVLRFGTVSPGDKMFIEVRFAGQNGQLSAPSMISVIAD